MDDLISRAAALKHMKEMAGCATCDNYNYVRCRACGWNDAMNIVEELPAMDAAPVAHGYWVKMTGMMPPEYHGHYECSECQWHMKGLRNSWTREEELSYCPNCGAKMDGERRESE